MIFDVARRMGFGKEISLCLISIAAIIMAFAEEVSIFKKNMFQNIKLKNQKNDE